MKNKRKRNSLSHKSSTIYAIVIAIILGAYISMFAFSYFTKPDGDASASKLNKAYTLNNYDFYIVDKTYNPDTKLLITKIFFNKATKSSNYIPLTKEYFKFKSTFKSDDSKSVKTTFLMPGRNYMVVATHDVEPDEPLVKLELTMKEDIVSQSKDNVGKNLAFYLDIPKKFHDKNLVLKKENDYKTEAIDQDIKLLKKNINKEEDSIEKLKKEILIAEEQIEIVEKDEKIVKGEEKIDIEEKKNDLRALIESNEKEIKEKQNTIIKIQKDIQELENEKSSFG